MTSRHASYTSTVRLGTTSSNDSRRGGATTAIIRLPRVALLSLWGALAVAASGTSYGQAVKPEERNARAEPSNEQVRSTEGPIFRAGRSKERGCAPATARTLAKS